MAKPRKKPSKPADAPTAVAVAPVAVAPAPVVPPPIPPDDPVDEDSEKEQPMSASSAEDVGALDAQSAQINRQFEASIRAHRQGKKVVFNGPPEKRYDHAIKCWIHLNPSVKIDRIYPRTEHCATIPSQVIPTFDDFARYVRERYWTGQQEVFRWTVRSQPGATYRSSATYEISEDPEQKQLWAVRNREVYASMGPGYPPPIAIQQRGAVPDPDLEDPDLDEDEDDDTDESEEQMQRGQQQPGFWVQRPDGSMMWNPGQAPPPPAQMQPAYVAQQPPPPAPAPPPAQSTIPMVAPPPGAIWDGTKFIVPPPTVSEDPKLREALSSFDNVRRDIEDLRRQQLASQQQMVDAIKAIQQQAQAATQAAQAPSAPVQQMSPPPSPPDMPRGAPPGWAWQPPYGWVQIQMPPPPMAPIIPGAAIQPQAPSGSNDPIGAAVETMENTLRGAMRIASTYRGSIPSPKFEAVAEATESVAEEVAQESPVQMVKVGGMEYPMVPGTGQVNWQLLAGQVLPPILGGVKSLADKYFETKSLEAQALAEQNRKVTVALERAMAEIRRQDEEKRRWQQSPSQQHSPPPFQVPQHSPPSGQYVSPVARDTHVEQREPAPPPPVRQIEDPGVVSEQEPPESDESYGDGVRYVASRLRSRSIASSG